MTLLGRAIVSSFNDVVPEGRENLYQWHNREHMPERLAIPGFLRGRRFSSTAASPEFFILYEVADLAVAGSQAYLDRLNNPTPWTKQSSKNFRNSFRSAFRVAYSAGVAAGGFALPIRCDAADFEALEARLVEEILPPIEPLAGVTGVHLAIYDKGISGIETVERSGRGAPFAPIPVMIIVEGISEAVLEQVRADHLPVARLEAAGARGPFAGGIYRMEVCHLP